MPLLFGAPFVQVYLHLLVLAYAGTEALGKTQAQYLLVLAIWDLQSTR